MKLPRDKNQLNEMSMARSEANPGERLLSAARNLFYSQGYAMAGINDVIEKSNTSKKSFYNYYPSKSDLGRAFLLLERENLYDIVEHFIEKNPMNFDGFILSWSRFLKKMGKSHSYKGCPFANLSAQSNGEFNLEIKETMNQLKNRIIDYLETLGQELTRKDAEKKAKHILASYQGSIQMWKLTGDVSYFDQFKENFIS